jgi:NADH-quinone oxidoreductase subunit N
MDLAPIQENLRSAALLRPELALIGGALVLFLADLLWRKSPRRVALLAGLALAVLALTAVFLALQPEAPETLFNRLVAHDAFATFFKWLALAATALTVLIASQGRDLAATRQGEFHALLLTITLGLFLMASATDLLMIYLSIEMVSLGSYVLAGFRKGDRKAAEASLKYVIYGGVASGVMLFGMSLLYGLLGGTDILRFAARLQDLGAGLAATPALGSLLATKVALVVAVVFVSAGVGYKIAAVPWHMWCPDVYEGAPTPFTAFLSVGPKAAGFAVAVRLFYSALAGPASASGFAEAIGGIPWPAVVGVISAITMTLGNLTAIAQTNLKRLLAYSSIAHAGYILMGLAAVSVTGMQGVMLYLLVYLVMNLGAFLVVIVVSQTTGSESIFEYRGLARSQPLAAVSFAIFLFSLTGIPPFAGFAGKWYLFLAVIERVGGPGGGWYATLALIGALNTAVSLYYYARIIRAMFLEAPYTLAAPHTEAPIRPPAGYQVMLGAFAAAILVFGLWWSPMIEWTARSLVFFRG